MKNYICRVNIQFNDKNDKMKEYVKDSIYKCDRKRYEELKDKYNALTLLQIKRRKK